MWGTQSWGRKLVKACYEGDGPGSWELALSQGVGADAAGMRLREVSNRSESHL